MLAPSLYRRAIPAGARVTRWRAPDGWHLRRFSWPAEGGARGSILFQCGRGDAFEKYLELLAHWHAAGWNVASLDWRGQGGSGRLGRDANVGHCDDFGGLVGDLEGFWADWAATAPRPHALVGHSMGGHLVLRTLLGGLIRPDAAVLASPMLGLHSPVPNWLGERVARVMARVRGPARAAWKASERPGRFRRQDLLTHDDARYADELWWQETQPELKLGPPSWAWVAEAYRSTRRQRADPRLDTLDVPVLALLPTADKLIDPAAVAAVAHRLPRGELVTWGLEARHELLREADPVRDAAIAAIDRFLDRHAPAP